jgi:hypothetical protein
MKRALGLAACSAILVSGLLLVSTKAIAAIQVPEQNPGLLSIWTDSYPLEYQDMDPGESAYVRLNIDLDDTDRGDLELEVRKDGDLATMAGGLEVMVERCDVDWANVPSGVTSSPAPTCASGRTTLLWADSNDDYGATSPRWALGEITDTETVFLLVSLALPSSTPAAATLDRDASFGFGLFAEGTSVVAPITPTRLALTGLDVLSLALIAIGAIGAGVIATRSRRSEVAA